MGRAPSTISREVNANGRRGRYRALKADDAACRRARRPKTAKLTQNHRLRARVEAKLVAKWSPEEISGWLATTYPTTPRCTCHTRPVGAKNVIHITRPGGIHG
jgi:transposase, IS30 family